MSLPTAQLESETPNRTIFKRRKGVSQFLRTLIPFVQRGTEYHTFQCASTREYRGWYQAAAYHDMRIGCRRNKDSGGYTLWVKSPNVI